MTVENLVTVSDPYSPASEVYRKIRTNIDFVCVDKEIKVINITSTQANEGKTTTACNLAVMYANKLPRVLLVDTDLRKPSVHKIMNIKNKLGLTDFVLKYSKNECDINKVNINDHIKSISRQSIAFKLDVMTTGSLISNPSEFLGSMTFKKVLSSLKQIYDMVVIDSAPSGITVDGLIVSKSTDATLYVVEYNKIRIDDARQVIEKLKNLGANVIGTILTKQPLKNSIYKYYTKKEGSLLEKKTIVYPKELQKNL